MVSLNRVVLSDEINILVYDLATVLYPFALPFWLCARLA